MNSTCPHWFKNWVEDTASLPTNFPASNCSLSNRIRYHSITYFPSFKWPQHHPQRHSHKLKSCKGQNDRCWSWLSCQLQFCRVIVPSGQEFKCLRLLVCFFHFWFTYCKRCPPLTVFLPAHSGSIWLWIHFKLLFCWSVKRKIREEHIKERQKRNWS